MRTLQESNAYFRLFPNLIYEMSHLVIWHTHRVGSLLCFEGFCSSSLVFLSQLLKSNWHTILSSTNMRYVCMYAYKHCLHILMGGYDYFIPFSRPFLSSSRLWNVKDATCGFPHRFDASTSSSNLIHLAVSFQTIPSPLSVNSCNSMNAWKRIYK